MQGGEAPNFDPRFNKRHLKDELMGRLTGKNIPTSADQEFWINQRQSFFKDFSEYLKTNVGKGWFRQIFKHSYDIYFNIHERAFEF
jgi:hypothetical protein